VPERFSLRTACGAAAGACGAARRARPVFMPAGVRPGAHDDSMSARRARHVLVPAGVPPGVHGDSPLPPGVGRKHSGPNVPVRGCSAHNKSAPPGALSDGLRPSPSSTCARIDHIIAACLEHVHSFAQNGCIAQRFLREPRVVSCPAIARAGPGKRKRAGSTGSEHYCSDRCSEQTGPTISRTPKIL
jgi:hypothetical protein